jgi:transposase-like protein
MKRSKSEARHGRFTEPERQAIIAEYRTGALSQAAIASKYGISKSTIQNWLRSHREKEAISQKLVPVRLKGFQASSESNGLAPTHYEVILKTNRKLRMASGFNPEDVRLLLKVLEESC